MKFNGIQYKVNFSPHKHSLNAYKWLRKITCKLYRNYERKIQTSDWKRGRTKNVDKLIMNNIKTKS